MSIVLAPLWDFNRTELSEQRFRAPLAGTGPDDALILQTQDEKPVTIAREISRVASPHLPLDHL